MTRCCTDGTAAADGAGVVEAAGDMRMLARSMPVRAKCSDIIAERGLGLRRDYGGYHRTLYGSSIMKRWIIGKRMRSLGVTLN
jgi:hypothetical protein